MSKTKEFIDRELQENNIDIIAEQLKQLDADYQYFVENYRLPGNNIDLNTGESKCHTK